jgi:MFS family permease
MKNLILKNIFCVKNSDLRNFTVLWSTQALSQLGSAMTNFALIIWLYEKTGSAFQTAMLSICSYAPYVMMSIFAGALSDRWNKKRVMLLCDTASACCTLVVLVLLMRGTLVPWHMYLLNALNGLMNTVQQPASDVAMTLITPERHYQKASGMKSLSNSLVTIMTPVLATSIKAFGGINAVIYVDFVTFLIAFIALLKFISIPEAAINLQRQGKSEGTETLLQSVISGLKYLNENRLILKLILFLAGVNLVASAFDVVLPALILPRSNGGEVVLGIVNAFAGIATMIGSMIAAVIPAPENRIRVIYLTMLISLGTENFIMAFGHTPVLWCIGQMIGWILVPVMSANLDVILRTSVPVFMQGRVYSCRNTLQFFTIPVGFFLGGLLVDDVFEPLMSVADRQGAAVYLFGTGKGAGAAFVMFILGVAGVMFCLFFGKFVFKDRRRKNRDEK